MKKRASTTAAQLLLFSQPGSAGLGKPQTRRRTEQLRAQLARKFGVGWESRSDLENVRDFEAPERRRNR